MSTVHPTQFIHCCLTFLLGLGIVQSEVRAQQSLEGLTFQDALNVCIEAVSSGDLELATGAFQNLEKTFGNEEEYLQDLVQKRILPLKGLAELGAGKFVEASQTLEKLQISFPQIFQNNAALLYGLAQAHRGAGELGKARDVLLLYVSLYSGTLEAGLALLERADLFFLENRVEDGLEAIDLFVASSAPESLKMQGNLKAVQACLAENRFEEAIARMLKANWSITTMPELANLAFSALSCGEHAMTVGDYPTALTLFQLVPPKAQLLRLQRSKLDELSKRLSSNSGRSLTARNRHQHTYLQNLQGQLAQQLNALESSEDYTPAFYLHYGQCLLLDSQFYKAWLVFEYLALKDKYPEKVREEAHYRWVVCAHQLEVWEEALTIARNFVDRYPDSPLAPQALYLIAKSHLEQRRYSESNEILSDLIERFPNNPLHGRWLFTRGFNQVVLGSYEAAREDFNIYSTKHPQGPLLINAHLWTAITHFFEKNYSVCIEQLTTLLDMDKSQPLYPEVLYRLASAQYSAREYDLALLSIEDYLLHFERHQRVDEARVLKGDISMGKGALDDAMESFNLVSLESPDLYLYSVFQVGKILRAQEEYERLVSHFSGFLENSKAPRVRVSEALYWLGWAYQQQGNIVKAFPVFEEALITYGDDPNAAETQSILKALEQLKSKQDTPINQASSQLAKATDFKVWLGNEIASAKNNNTPTYLSRLILYYNNRYTKETPNPYPLLMLADSAPMEKLDPEALGKVGLAFIDQNDTRGANYCYYLIEAFPASNTRAMGYLGLARLASIEGKYDQARMWLNKSEAQVPVHPHMNESKLLLGSILTELREYDLSITTFENLLRLKSARGRPHAVALNGIARAHQYMGESDKAVAYYQRIYNMYRAYPDLVASAYWASARLFESMDRIPEAAKTLQEMLNHAQLSKFPEWEDAQQKLPELKPLLPVEVIVSEERSPNE
jgi:tetratricopeptide (TPR) repeat protein